MDSRLKAVKAIIKSVSENGIDSVKMKNITDDAGISRSNLYKMFANKEDILYECFQYIDAQIEELFKNKALIKNLEVMTAQQQLRCMWAVFYRYLITHPDETKFYYSYINSKTFFDDIGIKEISSFKSFSKIIRLYHQYSPEMHDKDDTILYLHLLLGTLMYANSVAVGMIQDTKTAEKIILSMIEEGLNTFFQTVDKK